MFVLFVYSKKNTTMTEAQGECRIVDEKDAQCPGCGCLHNAMCLCECHTQDVLRVLEREERRGALEAILIAFPIMIIATVVMVKWL